jgi:hypothetical protein
MKKFTLMFALLLVLSISGFAEGDIHTGGRTCLPEQTCIVDDGDIHTGGKSYLPANDNPVLTNIIDFLNSIFG